MVIKNKNNNLCQDKTLFQGSNVDFDEAISVQNARDIPTPTISDNEDDVSFSDTQRKSTITRELIDTDSEDDNPRHGTIIAKSRNSREVSVRI